MRGKLHDSLADVLDGVSVANIWQGGDPTKYTSGNFPAWLATQQSGGAALRQNFPADFHNNRQPVPELACGTASTFVLTASTGSSGNARSLVLMIEHGDFAAVFTGDAEGTTEARPSATSETRSRLR